MVLAVALSACVADLPAPTQCPPAAKQAATDCTPTLSKAGPGCPVVPSTVSCMAKRDSCECGDECPADSGSCFPNSDCPRFITDRVSGSVTCLRLPREALSGGPASCTCGCAACASVCDGAGPIIAALLPQNTTSPALYVQNMNTLLPSSGRMGLYFLVRGLAGQNPPAVGVITPAGAVPSPLTLPSATDFSEVLVYDPSTSPKWSKPEERPTGLAIFPQMGATILEIDCIIPFVVAE